MSPFSEGKQPDYVISVTIPPSLLAVFVHGIGLLVDKVGVLAVFVHRIGLLVDKVGVLAVFVHRIDLLVEKVGVQHMFVLKNRQFQGRLMVFGWCRP